ncbi:MAG: putative glutamine amidotransferase [Chthoniobacteraceae bacterium]|nr:putative glutamine amidotransferase [Chthoniobacteraceae bacterium]
MPLPVASWIREKDEPLFARFFSSHHELILQNARGEEGADLELARGVLITGGPDIAVQFHLEGTADASLIRDPEPERDAWEFKAVKSALERGLPIFCICKGFQVLNVALGGTLQMHVDGHEAPEQRDQNIQPLRHAPGARHRFEFVNSSHHQALDRVASGLEVEAWCAEDDVIEQVRLRDYPFCLAVQYHPERDLLYTPLFEEFIAHIKSA